MHILTIYIIRSQLYGATDMPNIIKLFPEIYFNYYTPKSSKYEQKKGLYHIWVVENITMDIFTITQCITLTIDSDLRLFSTPSAMTWFVIQIYSNLLMHIFYPVLKGYWVSSLPFIGISFYRLSTPIIVRQGPTLLTNTATTSLYSNEQ